MLDNRSRFRFLNFPGEMAALILDKDWSTTPFGPIDTWSTALRSAVSICLGSRFPMVLYWGETRALIYNDAWSPVPGQKHPWALGRPGFEVWSEIWDIIGPMFDHVMEHGEATWSEDQLLPLNRFGYVEECYFYYSYSPVRGESGTVEGIFTAVTETTDRVLAERRERLLRGIAEHTSNARSAAEVVGAAVSTLSGVPQEAPFALAYAFDAAAGSLTLVARGGAMDDGALAPSAIAVEARDPWPFAEALGSGAPVPVLDVRARAAFDLPGAPWPEPIEEALVVPILSAKRDAPYGFLVVGLSPRRRIDRDYITLFERVAAHISTALTNVEAYEVERRRAEQLAAIDRAKTVFFSNASHELRTPLTLMLGPLEELLEQVDDANRDQLRLIQRNGQRLLRLVNGLLDFSRIEAGRDNARFVATDLAGLTADLASNFRSACLRAGLRLDVDCPPLPDTVYVDRAMWEKIVLNLMSNAFKFTLAGRIGVSLARDGNAAVLQVADSGSGIPAADLPRIFDRFHRVEGQRGRSVEGTGIGLSLVRELVYLHGGAIDVRSVVGEGTTFTVRLPFGRDHLPAEKIHAMALAAAPAHADAYVTEALGWAVGGSATAQPEAPHAAADGGSVVLADDNADMRAYVTRILTRAGYRVTAVGNGVAALDAVRAGALPDLVLSDVMMPEMDGFTLLKHLREDPATSSVTVILLSARAGEEARVEGLDAGADDYMVKPFSARELRARVDGAIALARQRRAAAVREQTLLTEIDIERSRAALLESEAHVASLFEADRRKDEFLAMLAHELRNPLAPIGAAAQLLQLGKLEPERVRQTSRIISRQVGHMTHLIDDLLDVSRVTRGQIELARAPLDVRDIVTVAIEQVAPLILARRHELVTQLAPSSTMVLGDKKRLVQVVTNLLTNAAKYTDEGGHIVLRVARAGADVEIEVSDDGIGMAPDLVAHAFDLFTQGERTSDRAMGGLGLGLALVKSLVGLHGGSVHCRSDGLGHGSIFTVRLPRSTASGAHPDSGDLGAAAAPDRPPRLKILIVDDNVDAAAMLGMLLEMDGHEVFIEHGSRAGLARAAALAPDACLLDIGLPDMDGHQLAHALRAQAQTARAVLIAITGYGQEQDRKRSADAGFDYHLVKPIDVSYLQAIFREI